MILSYTPHLRNDLYCVEWDIKPQYTIPLLYCPIFCDARHEWVNPLMPDFIFQCEKWLVRASGECIETNFHFTDKWPFYMILSYTVPFWGR